MISEPRASSRETETTQFPEFSQIRNSDRVPALLTKSKGSSDVRESSVTDAWLSANWSWIRESREKGDSDGWRTKLSLRTYEVVRRPGRARDEFRCRLPKHAPPPIRTANGAPSVPHAARNQLQCVPVSLRRSRFPSLTTIDSSIRELVQAPLPWTTLADLQREEPLPRIGFLQQVNAGPEGMNDSAERHRR
ncbi:uncharacterized protein LOC124175628 [Neodiprion fabricii]|uniref:uncharacterized protein LOC124175628 n=1 Tax=Neodiprion fabricii TaxID=2872261 RepID=UPI001ED90EBE|nr:uncharacterized protein LOC124175628 [Neodiprion fabricii]